MAIASSVRQQQRTVEREHSIYAFRKQANLVERTWYNSLRAMTERLSFCNLDFCEFVSNKISAFGSGPVRCPGAISILSQAAPPTSALSSRRPLSTRTAQPWPLTGWARDHANAVGELICMARFHIFARSADTVDKTARLIPSVGPFFARSQVSMLCLETV